MRRVFCVSFSKWIALVSRNTCIATHGCPKIVPCVIVAILVYMCCAQTGDNVWRVSLSTGYISPIPLLMFVNLFSLTLATLLRKMESTIKAGLA